MAKQTNSPAPHAGEPVLDPKSPASKPQGTTKDQMDTMESEGQAQQPGQEPVPEFDKDQPNEPPSQPNHDPVKHEEPVPSFDEGEPKPPPIESTTVDDLRTTSPDPRTVPSDGPDDVDEEPSERNTK